MCRSTTSSPPLDPSVKVVGVVLAGALVTLLLCASGLVLWPRRMLPNRRLNRQAAR